MTGFALFDPGFEFCAKIFYDFRVGGGDVVGLVRIVLHIIEFEGRLFAFGADEFVLLVLYGEPTAGGEADVREDSIAAETVDMPLII